LKLEEAGDKRNVFQFFNKWKLVNVPSVPGFYPFVETLGSVPRVAHPLKPAQTLGGPSFGGWPTFNHFCVQHFHRGAPFLLMMPAKSEAWATRLEYVLFRR
jgi:hypothetical protein